MRACARCGQENPGGFMFCGACGAPLEQAEAPREVRKTVTVVFCDLTGSTALGERLDPETVRATMRRYFEDARGILERHGGTVEKFIGDAVMAVFGVPQLHEDDALRAVRAAVEMRQALGRLNDEFERTWGVEVATRIGVNTGEVIAGDPGTGQSFVVGEAVNVASRLEQAAQPGEILIGSVTERLVRDAVVAEEAGPLSLKGMPEPVSAWRLLDVVPGAEAGWARNPDSPLVGREHELELLRDAFGRAADRGACELVSVFGAAGVGKSRLVGAFLGGVEGDATVITGRCLPYGEGITFWPIVGVLRGAAGIMENDAPADARTKLAELVGDEGDGPLIRDRLAGLLGFES